MWERIEPLLPTRQRRFRYPGRKPLDDRRVLQGILFVLHTGIGWEHLPQELGFDCGMTAWRRLRAWQQAGVWGRLHALLLAELHAADPARVGAGDRRLQSPASVKGRQNGSRPGRSRPRRQQALPTRRRRRRPARLDAVLDTVKGADLGGGDSTLVVDFNFAYDPSCAYDAAWACPLTPAANRLPLRVEAGELTPRR
jgi:transposase